MPVDEIDDGAGRPAPDHGPLNMLLRHVRDGAAHFKVRLLPTDLDVYEDTEGEFHTVPREAAATLCTFALGGACRALKVVGLVDDSGCP